jgi:eukaryotic-like serine/threonine-protein kinase
MDGEKWARLNRLLDQALDLPAEERAQWIAGLGPEAETMKARLLALLAHAPSVQGSGFLSAVPTLDIGPISGDEDRVDQPGATIGPYRLLRTLGEGGMGTVWLAERTDGMIRRAVALKLPRGAWPRAEFVERMARERDILASLAHPHIARLYDAGITPGGHPYLALEYVEGRRLDDYCRERGLDVRARLRVFLQV